MQRFGAKIPSPPLARDGDPFVWLQTAFLGDVILTTAAIGLARRAFPRSPQWVVSTPAGCEILRHCPDVAGTIPWIKRGKERTSFARIRQDLGSLRDDAIILQPHRSLRSTLLARSLRRPILTYRETAGSLLWARQRVARVAVLHETARVGLLLEPLGLSREDIASAQPRLTPAPLPEDGWGAELAALPRPRVLLAPGSVWPTKRWPASHFAEVARALATTGASLVVTGSAGEREAGEATISGLSPGSKALNLAGRTTLSQLAAVFPACDLVVANDSAPVHWASAFGIPTVALFGPTVPTMGFGPRAENSRALGTEGLGCRPCSVHGTRKCPQGHFRCMRDLQPRQVARHCQDLLTLALAST